MLKYFPPLKRDRSRGDATMSVILAILAISAVFLTGGILPSMREDTLNKKTSGVVEGVRSEDSDGQSLIAAAGSSNDSKKSLQMKQLILSTPTPTPIATSESSTPTSEPDLTSGWTIIYSQTGCSPEIPIIAFGKLEINGLKSGILKIFVNTTPQMEVINTTFTSPKTVYDVILSGKDGFSSYSWTVQILVDGVEKKQKIMPKIYC